MTTRWLYGHSANLNDITTRNNHFTDPWRLVPRDRRLRPGHRPPDTERSDDRRPGRHAPCPQKYLPGRHSRPLGSFLTVFPFGTPRPVVSDLNFTAGEIVPNLVVVKLNSAGVSYFNAVGVTAVIADVAGWYVAAA
jgi:hypothetical protein